MIKKWRIALAVSIVLLAAGGIVATLADPVPPYLTIVSPFVKGPEIRALEVLPNVRGGGHPSLPPGVRPISQPDTGGSIPQGGKNLSSPARGVALGGGIGSGTVTPQQQLETRLKSLARELR